MSLSPIGTEPAGSPEVVPLEPTDAWSGGWPQSPEEFQRLMALYLDRLVRYAFRRLGRVEDAEDAVQEVCVRAYADRVRLRTIRMPGPYLYRMVANACTDALRKRKDGQVSLEEVDAEEFRANGISPSAAAAEAEGLRRARELLAQLPEPQAEVIRLRVFDELRLHEIAETVGCSVDTVSSRLRYGFRKLRELVSRKRGMKP